MVLPRSGDDFQDELDASPAKPVWLVPEADSDLADAIRAVGQAMAQHYQVVCLRVADRGVLVYPIEDTPASQYSSTEAVGLDPEPAPRELRRWVEFHATVNNKPKGANHNGMGSDTTLPTFPLPKKKFENRKVRVHARVQLYFHGNVWKWEVGVIKLIWSEHRHLSYGDLERTYRAIHRVTEKDEYRTAVLPGKPPTF
jgi:hypothetical protein